MFILGLIKISVKEHSFNGSEISFADLKKEVAGCLIVLRGLPLADLPKKSDLAGKLNGKIFISYHPSDKMLVEKLQQELTVAGIHTITVDKNFCFSEDHFALMSGEMKQAKSILIFYSDEYKKCPDCRFQAESAKGRQKQIIFLSSEKGYKPEGWLECLIENNSRYELVGDENHFKLISSQLILRLKESQPS